jgi:hypothetical protein
MDRNPNMAKILELKLKWSLVIARIAGTLSIAKTTSITSMTTNATNKGGSSNMSAFYEKFFINVI